MCQAASMAGRRLNERSRIHIDTPGTLYSFFYHIILYNQNITCYIKCVLLTFHILIIEF